MKSHTKGISDRATVAEALRQRVLLTTAMLITVGTLVAACGGDSPSGGVPSLGTHTTGNRTAGSSTTGSNEAGEGEPGSQALAYSACMRSHGVPNFPDPIIHHSAHGTSVKMIVGVGTFKHDPQASAAQEACHRLLPNGGIPPHETVTPQEQTQYLKAAACIRSHGVPSFPDPTFEGGGVHIPQKYHDLNSSPAFKAAVEDCKSLIPGGVQGSGGPHSSSQGSSQEAAQ
jgi:hypothetical protein